MKKSRIVAAAVGAALFSLSLAACSSGSNGASGGKQTLIVEDYFQASYNPAYEDCAKQVGVKVNISHVPGAGLMPKILQQASSKTLPDVLMIENSSVSEIAATGALSPLKDYGLSGNGDVPSVLTAGTYTGTLYGLAPTVDSIALFYNTDIFKKAGLTPPKTWDELRADAKTLTSGSNYGFAMSNIDTSEGTWQFMPFFWTSGGNEKNIDTAGAVRALQFVTDLQRDGSMSQSSVSWTQGDVNSQFIAGKAAMMINGPWNLPALNAAKNLHFASVPIPTPTSSTKVVAPLGGETFDVPNTNNKTHMMLAGKFVGCLNSPSMQLKIAGITGNVPSNEKAAATWATSHPQTASFVTTVRTARAQEAELGQKWPTAATAIFTAVQLSLTGKATPSEALQRGQAQNH